MSKNARLLSTVALVLTFSLLSQYPGYSDPTNDPIAIRLTVLNRIVKVGNPVLIRVEIVNQSSQNISLRDRAPWEMVKLSIHAGEKVVQPTGSIAPLDYMTPIYPILHPGEAHTYRFRSTSPNGLDEFHSISDWGYQHLTPGQYTITASPVFVGVFGTTTKMLPVSPENRSNSLSVEVRP